MIHLPLIPGSTIRREKMASWKDDGSMHDIGLGSLREGVGRIFFGDRNASEVLFILPGDLPNYLKQNDPHYISTNDLGILIHGRERLAGVSEVIRMDEFCNGFVAALPEDVLPMAGLEQRDY